MCHFLPNGQTPWRGHEVPVSTSRVCAHRLAPCVILSGTWHQMPLNCRSKPYVNTGKLFRSSFRIFVRCSLIPCGETFSFVKWEGVINYWGICQWGTHSSCIVSVFSIKKDTNSVFNSQSPCILVGFISLLHFWGCPWQYYQARISFIAQLAHIVPIWQCAWASHTLKDICLFVCLRLCFDRSEI